MEPSPLLFDLTGRGAVILTGKDRASFLHGLVTNDVKKLTPGTGCAAAFLTPKGKLLADCVVLCEEDRLEIDCEPELAEKIEDLLRKYLVFNEVEIGNDTEQTAVFHLRHSAAGEAVEEFLKKAISSASAAAVVGLQHSAAGDAVEELLRKEMGRDDSGAGVAWPRAAHSHAMANVRLPASFPFEEKPATPDASRPAGDEVGIPIRLVRENRTGVPGYDVRCSSSLSEEIRKAFLLAGARQASGADLESLRIEAGIPRWGFELTEAVLPDEAALRERGFVSDSKGCYIGQETVARIKTYGHVNRNLVRLHLEGEAPAAGSEIFFEGEKAGSVTSAARTTDAPQATALGFVRRERAVPGTLLLVRTREGDRTATVSAPPVA
ncbi:MAG TPA: glycine cleavage T C-terminal barrel domain-containing protein [Thermoanaerobaculia bacterium]|nr:glycine cleavage T C-terminal barrel domain-containing protein [Thermoanaerobaculia bacterium]